MIQCFNDSILLHTSINPKSQWTMALGANAWVRSSCEVATMAHRCGVALIARRRQRATTAAVIRSSSAANSSMTRMTREERHEGTEAQRHEGEENSVLPFVPSC